MIKISLTTQLFTLMAVMPYFGFCQKAGEMDKYLGQKPPGNHPQIFAPDFISIDTLYEFGSVFSADGLEFFYGVNISFRPEIRYTRYVNGKWHQPITVISDPDFGMNDPFLSPDEDELYYISDRPSNPKDRRNDHNIWYSKRQGDSWSPPIDPGPSINTDANEYYISFTSTGTMYFSSNKNAKDDYQNDFDIYTSQRLNGEYLPAKILNGSVNTEEYEADVFVAYDESYLIFSGNRKEGLGQGDLYVSFRGENGQWGEAKNMTELINTPGHELCPFVTKDGKYLFYTSNQDIYWVDAQVLEQFR